MNTSEGTNGEGGRDEIIAGEYVLGVLSIEARRAAEERMVREPEFAARVRRWEHDLAGFNEDYEAVAPPRTVFDLVETRLFPSAERTGLAAARASGGLWNSLVFWRGLALASLLVVAGMAAMVVEFAGQPRTGAPLVAELSAQNGPISLVARYDRASGSLQLTPVAAKAGKPHSLELWMINGKQAPVSLGVLPQNGRGEIVVPAQMRGKFAAGTVLAVSLEPEGGSPTGKPTGPVLASGSARTL